MMRTQGAYTRITKYPMRRLSSNHASRLLYVPNPSNIYLYYYRVRLKQTFLQRGYLNTLKNVVYTVILFINDEYTFLCIVIIYNQSIFYVYIKITIFLCNCSSNVSFLLLFHYIFVSASSLYLAALAIPMREASCMGCTPAACL